MFKKSYNRAVLGISIETLTPLRIGAGDAGLDPTSAELACVRTHHGRLGSTVYIPGSSLKGVLRSAAEATVRGGAYVSGVQGACDPLDRNQSCSAKRTDRDLSGNRTPIPSHEIYRQQCLACRLFGSLRIKGRAAVRDLYPWKEGPETDPAFQPGGTNFSRANQLERRNSVSINRITGGVKNGPFEQELVPAGISFFGEIALENYQVWQLGLLEQAFGELNEGFAQLGASTSRGLGLVRLSVESILHEQALTTALEPVGVGLLVSKQEQQDYGLLPERQMVGKSGEIRGLSRRFCVTDRSDTDAWRAAALSALQALRSD